MPLRLGRQTAFRLEPTGDPLYEHRLILPDDPAGWLVLSYTADALAPPRRPMLRVVRQTGETQDAVLPGPALGRALWLGLIPQDTAAILLSLGPDTILERVGRRSAAGIVAECFIRRPGHAVAAIYERAMGQARRSRDTLRGGVAVSPLRRFAAWSAGRGIPFHGGGRRHAIACLVLARRGDDAALARTLRSLAAQNEAPARIEVAWDEAPPTGMDAIRWDPHAHPASLAGGADALCLLRAGDELAADALALLSARLGDGEFAYADSLSEDGTPRLKPDWSQDLALATGYAGRPALVATSLLARLPRTGLGPHSTADIALDIAVAAACDHAVHVARPLARVADRRNPNERTPLLRHGLRAAGSPASAREIAGVTDLLWPLPDAKPLVSIVIPSRDRIDLIRPICHGVLKATEYPALELIVVDNGSTDPAVLRFYDELRREPRARILPFPQPFNFAAMVNAGVAAAAGEIVVLLNNDIAVREPGWLGELVRQALRPGVGAVGAKLLFGDGTLQHAGVVIGLGGRAGHILRRRPADTPGHLGRLRVAHEVSAVTAACLAVSAEKYRAVGGFDAEAFPVDFNDVDFCLRLAAAGWKTIWTPAATLSHFESVSRGPSVGAKRARFEAEAARFVDRWGAVIRHDPFYHPALSLTTFGEDLE